MKNETLDYKQTIEQSEPVVNEEIQILPFSFLSILDFSIQHKSGEHSELTFYGMVSEEEAKKYNTMDMNLLQVEVKKKIILELRCLFTKEY